MKLISKQSLFQLFSVFLILIIISACTSTTTKPDTSSEKYKQAVSDFYISLGAIQSDQALFAVEKMQAVADAYPAEPAAWANLGVYAVRQGNFELATTRMEKALEQADQNADIQFLAGILESRRGNIETSLEHLQSAAELDSTNPQILFALADELERQDPEGNTERIKERLNTLLEILPNNLAVLLEKVRTAAKWGDQAELKQVLQNLDEQSKNWPDQIRSQFQDQKTAILEKEGENISFELAFLRNNLNQLTRFQHDLREVQLPANQVGFLITEFLWLPNAEQQAAPMDENLTFTASEESSNESVQLYSPVGLANEQKASSVAISGNRATVRGGQTLTYPGNNSSERLPPHTVTGLRL